MQAAITTKPKSNQTRHYRPIKIPEQKHPATHPPLVFSLRPPQTASILP